MYVLFQALYLMWNVLSLLIYRGQHNYVQYHLFTYPEDSKGLQKAMAISNNTILQLDIFLKKSGDYEFSFDCGDSTSEKENFSGNHLKTLIDCQIKSYSISKKGVETTDTVLIESTFIDKLERQSKNNFKFVASSCA